MPFPVRTCYSLSVCPSIYIARNCNPTPIRIIRFLAAHGSGEQRGAEFPRPELVLPRPVSERGRFSHGVGGCDTGIHSSAARALARCDGTNDEQRHTEQAAAVVGRPGHVQVRACDAPSPPGASIFGVRQAQTLILARSLFIPPPLPASLSSSVPLSFSLPPPSLPPSSLPHTRRHTRAPHLFHANQPTRQTQALLQQCRQEVQGTEDLPIGICSSRPSFRT